MAERQAFTLKMGQRKRLVPILAGLLTLGLAVTAKITQPEFFNRLGNLLFDVYQRAAPREYQDAGVRVIDIDDESIKLQGQWPWPRTDLAQLVDKLADAGAAVVAFDVVFSETDRTSPNEIANTYRRLGVSEAELLPLERLQNHDVAFAEAIENFPVVLGYFMSNEADGKIPVVKARATYPGTPAYAAIPAKQSAILPLEVLETPAVGTGFVSIDPDTDGIIRKAPLINRIGEDTYPSLSMDALRVAIGEKIYKVKSSDASGEIDSGEPVVEFIRIGNNANFTIPTTGNGEMWVHFTKDVPERVVPAWKILHQPADDAQMREWFEGRIVFVGTSAAGLLDLVATPMSPSTAGVLVHAQMTEQMIVGHYLTKPDWGVGVETMIIVFGGLILVFLLPIIGALRGGVLALAVIGGVVYFSWYQFTQNLTLFDPTFPGLGLFAIALVTSSTSFLMTEAEKAYIKDAFDLYLSPEMVNKIADDPKLLSLGGVERDLTVLFCDIRGFSKISEKLGPSEITTFLNNFLTPMTDILMEGKATIDKYIGDAIVTFWNAPLDDPDHHANAARSALRMMSVLADMNEERLRDPENAALPVETNIGIGLNSGPCSVGNMGSKQRFAYSVLGDTVNLASRLEGLTKQYGAGIVIGEKLTAALPNFATLELDRLRVVGRDTPETISALVGDEATTTGAAFTALKQTHMAFMAAYAKQDWESAEKYLRVAVTQSTEFKLNKYYDMMLERVSEYRKTPPGEGWDGVHQAYKK